MCGIPWYVSEHSHMDESHMDESITGKVSNLEIQMFEVWSPTWLCMDGSYWLIHMWLIHMWVMPRIWKCFIHIWLIHMCGIPGYNQVDMDESYCGIPRYKQQYHMPHIHMCGIPRYVSDATHLDMDESYCLYRGMPLIWMSPMWMKHIHMCGISHIWMSHYCMSQIFILMSHMYEAYPYVWHHVISFVMWLIHMCGITHEWCHTWIRHGTHREVMSLDLMPQIWHIFSMRDMNYSYVTSLISDATHMVESHHKWYDSSICECFFVHDSSICELHHIYEYVTCDMSSLCVTWLIHMWHP